MRSGRFPLLLALFLESIFAQPRVLGGTLNPSRRSFVMAFPSQKQEAFFEGHVRAFEHFGGVPHRLSYDNLTTAVKPLIEGRCKRQEESGSSSK